MGTARWLAFAMAAAVFLLILIAGCTEKKPAPIVGEEVAENASRNGSEKNETALSPCKEGNVLQRDECFYNLARERGDVELCKNIYSVEKIDWCYSLFANKSLEVCRKISNPELRVECLTENARREKSEEICNLIADYDKRLVCLKNVLPECMLLLDLEKRGLCIALEKEDYSYCSSDWCYYEYAKNKSDTSACEKISTPAERHACRAVVKRDFLECKLASFAAVQDYCLELASKRLGDPSGCDLATAGSDYRNRCYLHFAAERKDERFCEKVEPEMAVGSGTDRNWCYSEFAKETADVSVCTKIKISLLKAGCYYAAAMANRMPSLCNGLETGSQRTECYANSILHVEEGPVADDCGKVSDTAWKDKCYYRAAIVAYDKEICKFISQASDDARNCYAAFPD
ncbi:MAG: hypothetical protein N3G22_00895 [Candidatus Micrarchaeota archaeon]|nr:hypothetical protein [Candidatus Micrarchaeota archaeon]